MTSAALTFLSTPSARRATSPLPVVGQGRRISIHALREEGDAFPSPLPQRRKEFLSTPSARRATRLCRCITSPAGYFYPRPPRGGRPVTLTGIPGVVKFLSTPSARRATSEIYGEERAYQFLSTPSARRATCRLRQRQDWETNFYPRPPRGGRQAVSPPSATMLQNFYPRPPRGGRLPWIRLKVSHFLISIHALREEGDQSTPRRGAGSQNFYPRPPRGGRLVLRDTFDYDISISIHALREEGDPPFRALPTRCRAISIHALREEGDCATISSAERQQTFLSTPSARRATKEG